MIVFIVPDIHLKWWMFDAADRAIEKTRPDKVVLLGDIADDFGHKNDSEIYDKTFKRAIQFANDHPAAIWLYGNHDVSYMWNKSQSGTAYMAHDAAVHGLLRLYRFIALQNPSHLCFIERIDHVLFSHAGLCEAFIMEYLPSYFYQDEVSGPVHNHADDIVHDNPDSIADSLEDSISHADVNDMIHNDVDGMIHYINNDCHARELWDDISPIWLRPQKGFGDEVLRMYRPDTYLQVVGHTPMRRITYEHTDKKNILSCDVFSTSRDHKPYGTQEFCLLDTQAWKWTGIPCK